PAVRLMTPSDAQARLRDAPDDFVLLDVREPEELAIARVQGSLDIPMMTIPGRVAELDREREIAVMCHHGMRSMQVATWLDRIGYPRVSSVDGGIDEWARSVDHSIATY